MKLKIYLLVIGLVLLVGTFGIVSSADYKFQNSTGFNLTVINGTTGDMDVLGNSTASWFRGIFNWIIGPTSSNYLTFNGTELDFDESAMNTTIDTRIDSSSSTLSVNDSDLLDNYDSTFFMPLNTSVFGDFDFNGGWTSGGVSIIDGDFYGQTAYFYNITGLDVNTLKVNGSLVPQIGFDNQFDVGNESLRWRDLYLGGEVRSNGTGDNYFLGSVGIGTDTPSRPLSVYKSSDGSVANFLSYTDVSNFQGLYIDASQSTDMVTLTSSGASQGGFIFSDGVSDNMAILANGNVGIGTTAPVNKLEVAGTINATAIYIGTNNVSNINYVDIQNTSLVNYIGTVNTSNNNYIVDYVGVQNTSLVNYISTVNTSNNNYIVDYVGVQNTSMVNYITVVNTSMKNYVDSNNASMGNTFVPYTGADQNVVLGANNLTVDTSVLAVDVTNDRVGIGTSSPATILDVAGSITVGSSQAITSAGSWDLERDGDDRIRFQSTATTITGPNSGSLLNIKDGTSAFEAGDVGIGIAAPTELLHLDNSDTSTLFLDRAGTGVRMSLAFGDAGTKKWYMGMPDSDIAGDGSEFFIGTSQTTSDAALWIETSGNVGIGTSIPSTTLDIQASTNSTHILDISNDANQAIVYAYVDSDGDGILYVNDKSGAVKNRIYSNGDSYFNGGNVGIGTTAPVNELEVAGTINATAIYIGTNNVSNINYVDIQNTSLVNYISTVNTSNNNYIVDYVGVQNTSMINYIAVVNTSMKNYVDSNNASIGNTFVPYTGADQNVVLGANNLTVDTSVFVVDVNNDRVGIGTTSPATILDLYSTNDNVYVRTQTTDSTKLSGYKFRTNNADANIVLDYVSSNRGSLRFNLDTDLGSPSEVLTLDSSGNVGIGTTAPVNELEVSGTINATAIYIGTNNVSNINYVDIQNTSLVNYIGVQNTSLVNYIVDYVGIQNTSLVNYISIVNTSNNNYIVDYVGIQNTSLVNYIAANNASMGSTFVPYTGANQNTDLGNNNLSVNSTFYVNTNNGGNVGIGTDNPNGKLSVIHGGTNPDGLDSQVSRDVFQISGGFGSVALHATNTTGVGDTYDGDLAFMTREYSAGAYRWEERMRIRSDGNVGIGTTTPQELLHIQSSTTDAVLQIQGTANGNDSKIFLTEDGGAGASFEYNASGNRVAIKSGTGGVGSLTERISIMRDTGRVGIGTTSPTYELDVAGDIGVDKDIIHNGDTDTYIRFQADDVQIIVGGATAFHYDEDTINNLYLDQEGTADISLGGNMFVGGSGGSYDAKVGIGTTSPTSLLDVAHGSYVNEVNLSGTLFVNSTSGNVGIGTSSPYSKLFVASGELMIDYGTGGATDGAALRLFSNADHSYIATNRYYDGNTRYARTGGSSMIRFDTSTAATAGNIDIYTSASGTADATITSTQRMIIEQGGNVGIGTTSPVNELEVAGTINATAIYMGTNNVSNINYVDIQNQSMVNYIGVVNTSNNNYIVDYVGIQNTSLVNYISTVNTSNNNYIVDYVGIQNTSLVNYIGTVNTTRNNYLTSAYVPYTGANANLDLGANNLSVDTSVFAVDVTNDRVGIGIAAPTELLHLDNSGTSTLFLDRAGTGVRMSLAFGDAGTKKWYMGMPDSDIAGDGSEFFIGTSQTTADAALWIETSGNVGIGTTNPQNTLNVQGDINVTDTDISMYMEGGILVIEG